MNSETVNPTPPSAATPNDVRRRWIIGSLVRDPTRFLANGMRSLKREDGSPVHGAIEVDNVASPWHTIIEVRADDRLGVLHRVAAAMARAGVQIHHASVAARDGVAVDSFLVTGRSGGKLDTRDENRLRAALAGESPRRRLRRPGIRQAVLDADSADR